MRFSQFFTKYQWWGKLLGAFFGYLLAGPIGALWGIIIGNFFDRGLNEHFSHPHRPYYQEKRESIQKVFFVTTFLVMGHIAKADGRISEKEIQIASTLMDEMNLSMEQKKLAKHFFSEGKNTSFNLVDTLNVLHHACYDNLALLKLFVDIQYRAAQADGSEKKFQVLNHVFLRLGFTPRYETYHSNQDYSTHSSSSQQSYSNTYHQPQSQNHLVAAYALLAVDKNATQQEVKKAYRRLISRNHPDKLIAQGFSEEMIKKATERTQRIHKAYEEICTYKGW